jgi:Holliday junction resolvase
MATTPEGKVKAKVRKILDTYGAYHFMPATGGYGKSGVPDIVGCYHGYFFAIECKAGKGKTTALQDKNLDAIVATGGVAVVINEDNIDYVTTLMNMMNNGPKHEN